ncbi:DNA cytosine methyltransferase [Dehalobacter sp.]|uniref:DNA cytosine methyltransferase n=1 Tax=Dehalobacter sp. TaxID=1962289 RepID=UPI002588329A|nr:DNA cytosine methyltransferase [Dehalobacter sp.]MDJ0305104.1 DNA cytosine methyltransferase [Dehalobacter sp.]
MNAIDLFAGCGGLSKGFLDAGFNIIVGVDNDEAALVTFEKNHKGAIALNADLSKQETFDRIKELAGGKTIDVIIAGPPCQGFSLTGPRNFDDQRNKLYLAVFEVVRQFQPKGFVIENVPGMATLYGGQIKEEILKRFQKLGYNVGCKILNAADYGVPQIRKRLIFIGIREDIGNVSFPEPQFTLDTYRTCRDAISDLPSRVLELGQENDKYSGEVKTQYQRLMRGSNNVLYNHVATAHTQMVKDTISLVPEGGNYKDLPQGVGESRRFNEAWTRYDGNKPSRTIDTGHRNHFHYEYNRVPTIRENARLQSFPDDFVFYGTRTQQNRQVGNAVPPLLGFAIGKHLLSIMGNSKKGIVNTIDLFAGCGGLTEGFKQSGFYNTIACVEWDKAPCDNLRNHLKRKWRYDDAEERVLRFDIQRTKELIMGWDDAEYGKSVGLDALVSKHGGTVDLIIGGPPCQAYSIAGRIRDENSMKYDYRNYLFESYIEIVKHYQPRAFVFENVPGMLSSRPGDGTKLIAELICEKFAEIGYSILPNLKDAIINFAEYGIPQNRSRIIILGINSNYYGISSGKLLNEFYNRVLPSRKSRKVSTVRDAIGDLQKLYPLQQPIVINGRRYSHTLPDKDGIHNHEPRYSNARDMEVFKLLARDLESGENKYTSVDALKKLYTSLTGRESNIHKYHVLKWNEPSNLIPAHLYKDGLRHIHPDSEQSRTITPREAARLQTFPDDYEFISGTSLEYKMIGNAVPPLFAKILSESIYDLLFRDLNN